jgi:hypothetical protein
MPESGQCRSQASAGVRPDWNVWNVEVGCGVRPDWNVEGGVSSKRSRIKCAVMQGAKLSAEFKHSNRGGIGVTHQI